MLTLLTGFLALDYLPAAASPTAFLEEHCYDCHDADTHKGNLDLTELKTDFGNAETFARWVKVFDRTQSGEMPPKKKARPPADELHAITSWLNDALLAADRARLDREDRTAVRRLTRAEYENTVRDLLDLPGVPLKNGLPADGMAHGFDKISEALDISHVNVARYLEAADAALELAIATRPEPPTVQKRRISLANSGGFVSGIILNGDGVMLKNKQPDPDFPPAGEQAHIDLGAHERAGLFRDATVGLFRHEDESVNPYFIEHVTIYPGHYRVRTSLWAFQWNRGKVLPARGTEAARLSVVQLTGDGRGGQHPSYVLGYYDAPSLESKEHEVMTWLNRNEIIGFNVASLAPVANYNRKGRAMAFTGPGIACDWLEIEGPFNDVWPPVAHRTLFGDLPLAEFKAAENPGVRAPVRKVVRQIGAGKNRPDPASGLWTVHSEQPLVDADRLLASFLPKAFRHPVEESVRKDYVAKVAERLAALPSARAC